MRLGLHLYCFSRLSVLPLSASAPNQFLQRTIPLLSFAFSTGDTSVERGFSSGTET